MVKLHILLIMMLLFAISGCRQMSSWKPSSLNPLHASKQDSPDAIIDRHRVAWKTAHPTEQVRAEVIAVRTDGETLAMFAPNVKRWSDHPSSDQIRLASTGSHIRMPRVTHVDRRTIDHFGDLAELLDAPVGNGKDAQKTIQVDFQRGSTLDASTVTAANLSREQLVSFAHHLSPDLVPIRYKSKGVTWVHFRDHGVRLRFQARVSDQKGLVHLILGIQNFGESELLLPGNVRLIADGRPMSCLTVAETLETLYGDGVDNAHERDFATVSELNHYAIPSNYERLVKHHANGDANQSFPALLPEITLPYPGPAILGDARVLTGFVLQRKLLKPGSGEIHGWAIFGGADLSSDSVLELRVDLGNGERIIPLEIIKE